MLKTILVAGLSGKIFISVNCLLLAINFYTQSLIFLLSPALPRVFIHFYEKTKNYVLKTQFIKIV
jgi:hypothetical protein